MSLTVEELISGLRSEDRATRAKSLKTLGRLRARDAFDPICKMLESERDGNVKSLALKALGQLGRADAIPILLNHFNSAQSVVVSSLIRLGVFDDVMPESGRQRNLLKRALRTAKPELKDLVEQGRLTHEDLGAVLPPIM